MRLPPEEFPRDIVLRGLSFARKSIYDGGVEDKLAGNDVDGAGGMERMWWITAAVAGVGIGLGFVLWHFSNRVIHIEVWDEERIKRFEVESGAIKDDDLKELPREEAVIPSPYGYQLKGWFIPHEPEAKKTVIIVHGVTRSRFSSLKYVPLFRKRGYNILLYDQRRHGESGGETTTYGYFEKWDLKACVDWVVKRVGEDGVIGIHGESMGAATALQHASIDPRAGFYIADCPYSDIAGQLAFRLKAEYRFLASFPLIPLVGALCRLRAGFRLGDARSLESLREVETPILFIHGVNDSYIEKSMTEEMHRIKTGKKQLYFAPGADHAEAYIKNPDEYDHIIEEFLEYIGFN